MLRVMPDAAQAEVPPASEQARAEQPRRAMPRARALACPASLKGVLSAHEAAAALAEGLGDVGRM